MGQAKARGTFRQRQMSAIEREKEAERRRAEAKRKRDEEELQWLASLPPNKREAVLLRRKLDALRQIQLAALVVAAAGSMSMVPGRR
jgi:hypothetical protein